MSKFCGNNLVDSDLCPKIIFIFAEYLLGQSGVPRSYAPSVSEWVHQYCELAVNEYLENPNTMDIHSMLSKCFGISALEELVAILGTLFDKLLQSEAPESEYWLRIINTFELVLVIKAKSQRMGGKYNNFVDLALWYYHTAVKYAIVIDEDARRSNLLELLDKSLDDCRLNLEACIRDSVVVPDRIPGSPLRMESVALE